MLIQIFTTSTLYSVEKYNRLYIESANSSSYLKSNWNKYNENYHPNYAFDDNPKTAWVEGEAGYGIGESLSFNVSKLNQVEKIKIGLANGYQKSKKLFEANSSPKEIEVTFFDNLGHITLREKRTLNHIFGVQNLFFNYPTNKGLSNITLKILSVYKGKLYKDTCISDITLDVISKVPYNNIVELNKKNNLLLWAKERLKIAKYFASKPDGNAFLYEHYYGRNDLSRTSQNHSVPSQTLACKSVLPDFEEILQNGKKYKHLFHTKFDLNKISIVSQLWREISVLNQTKSWYKSTNNASPQYLPDFSSNGNLLITEKENYDIIDYIDFNKKSFFEVNNSLASDTKIDEFGSVAVSNWKVNFSKNNPTLPNLLIRFTKNYGEERGPYEFTTYNAIKVNSNGFAKEILIWKPLNESTSTEADGSEMQYLKFYYNDKNKITHFDSVSIYGGGKMCADLKTSFVTFNAK